MKTGKTKNSQVLFLNLEHLEFRMLGATKIPPEISKLKKLKQINIPYNNIDELPEEIGELSNLEILILMEANMTKLPQSIIKLRKLKHLDVALTNITELPPNLEKLENLEEFIIFDKMGNLPENRVPIIENLKKKMPNCEFRTG